jgi:hemolysin activation/secretion protein
MKRTLFFISLCGLILSAPTFSVAAEVAPAVPEVEQGVLRFVIERYIVEGASLLTQAEIDAAVAPYVGKDKDFSDVQRALEAIEGAYAERGFSAVRVLLPEQELEKGTVRFRVVESRFGKVTVKDNHFVSETNALNAVPSVRSGNVPRTKQIAREVKLANENPARQLNVVLKAGEKDDLVDANVIVTDSKPSSWGVSFDNNGASDTGFTRLGLSYRNANVLDKDHVASVQYTTSPQHTDRVKVLGVGYKVPLYQSGNSLEFSGGYSFVNARLGGVSNFQGGGLLFGMRYNFLLERSGSFDPRFSLGLDRRNFKRIELVGSAPFYNEIVVLPVSLAYAVQAKFGKSDVNFNVAYSANIPGTAKGKKADFAAYDQLNHTTPKANYRVLRYGASYARSIGEGWQFRTALNGQRSSDVLIQGEQIRLGGADAVRGFSEGSEGGESGARLNLEGYTPDFGKGDFRTRALVFYDAGQATSVNTTSKATIAAAGVGLRTNYGDQISLRLDWAQIKNAGTDPDQKVGDTRWHAGLNASF